MEKAGTRVFLVFVFISLCLLFLDLRGNLVFLRSGSSYLFSPVFHASSNVRNTFTDAFSFLMFWRSGEARIRNLEQMNLELLVKAGRTEELERENRNLRIQLGVAELAEKRLLPGRVLGMSRFLILGVGSNEGVKVGQIVVVKNILIGRVNRVSAKISHVLLPTDGYSKIPARIEGDGPVNGLVIGQYNSSIILDQIVQTDKIPENSYIVTSGEENVYLPGLLIGKAGRVLSKETDLFKKVAVKLIINYGKLDTVFVILN